ncbi:unnamed protein product [Phytophthora lilii]|uniref:Unnamed protein product n=1 Tax=Phytophthora lilii TaxID=2077276 RepID=A0A9W6WXQ1_9STRA|nr:unnamed protein product [Phytophthora lilii]
MTSNVVSTQLTSVNQLHEVARLLMQPPTSRRVSKVPAVHALKKILLTEQQLTDEFGVDLFSLLSVPVVSVSLTVLDLSFNELGDKFWLHWMPELKEAVWPALAILNLANNHPSLTQLDLSLNLFRDTNAPPEWLQPLIRVLNGKDRKHLEVLDMSCTDFTDQDIMQLLQAQFSKFLAKLYLRSNSLTNETAKTLANHLPQMKLEVLSLAGNMIGDSGAASLAFVMDQVLALQTLDLEENQVAARYTFAYYGYANNVDVDRSRWNGIVLLCA